MSQLLNKKICLLGEFGVGKTSLVERFVYNRFDDSYLTTIGVKVSEKLLPPVEVNGGFQQMRFMIWDIAGSEAGQIQHESYWTGASGALVITDLTRPDTFEFVRPLVEKFQSACPGAELILVGNKSDLILVENLSALEQRLMSLGLEFKMPLLLTSAKTGDGVEKGFQQLAETLAA